MIDSVAGDLKILPGTNINLFDPNIEVFYLNQKQKSYKTLKFVNSKFLKNRDAPLLLKLMLS